MLENCIRKYVPDQPTRTDRPTSPAARECYFIQMLLLHKSMQSRDLTKKIRHIAKTKKKKKKILENLQRYATSHAEHTVKAPKSCRRLLRRACVVPASFGSVPTTERLPQALHFTYKMSFLTSGRKLPAKASPIRLVKWPGGSRWSLCPAHPGPRVQKRRVSQPQRWG